MARKFEIRKTMIFHEYYSRLKNIALSIFKWEGLPPTCSERFLEDTLFHYGQAVFVNDPNMSFLNLRVNIAGDLNVYNEALAYQAYSTGYSEFYDADKVVIVRNNLLNKSTDSTVILFAERLAELDVAMQININAQKTPILIRCDDKTKTSLEAIYNQYQGDKPVIFGSKALQDRPLETLLTGAPFVADKLREEKRAVWNEALEFFGINTNPADKKKERVIVDEVKSNNEQIDIQALTMLHCREQACKDFAERFGHIYKTPLSVSLRVDELKRIRESIERGVA